MIGRPRNTGRLYSSKKRKLNDKICFIKKIKVHLQNVFMEIVWGICAVLKKYDVEDVGDLQASCCLGHCAKGVTVSCEGMEAAVNGPQVEVSADGYILHGVNADNVEELFAQVVYPKIFNA